MIRKLRGSYIAWFLFITEIMFIAAHMAFGYAVMIEVASAIISGMSLMIVIKWGREAAVSGRDGKSGPDFLIFAVALYFLMTFIHRQILSFSRWLDKPAYLVDSIFISNAVFLMGVAAALVVLAPGTKNGDVPDGNQVYLVAGLITAAGLIALALGLPPVPAATSP